MKTQKISAPLGFIPPVRQTGSSITAAVMCTIAAVSSTTAAAAPDQNYFRMKWDHFGDQRNSNANATPQTASLEQGALEDLDKIKSVLRPAMSDLALAIHVTRQSLYNWMNGETITEDNAAKLKALAEAADVIAQSGINLDGRTFKRKLVDGRTFFEAISEGTTPIDAANQVIYIIRAEAAQRAAVSSVLAKTPRRVVNDEIGLIPPEGNT